MSDPLARSNAHRVGKGKKAIRINPGFETDAAAWTDQLSELATRYRFVLFDHVGGSGADILAFGPHHNRSLRTCSTGLREITVVLRLSHVIAGAIDRAIDRGLR